MSLRKVSDNLEHFFGVKAHASTILRWIRKYVKLIDAYVETLEPQLSDQWNVDEMKVKIGGEWKWLWNAMDKDTKFLLSSRLTEKREVKDARAVFQECKERTKSKPEVIITDGLQSYRRAYNKEFYTMRKPRPEHIRSPGLRSRRNNNVVERLNGTVRERNKVMRGLKGEKSGQAITDGFRVYYNFIRPHQALDGQTPAEEADINLDLKGNKWMKLIKKSSRNRRLIATC